jgi:hypothetical protein
MVSKLKYRLNKRLVALRPLVLVALRLPLVAQA